MTDKKIKSEKKFKESFGTNPWDPWSAKANLDETSEAQLAKYLLSRGINPQYVAKNTKIAHSKSNQFKQWVQYHREENELEEDMGHIAMRNGAKTHQRKQEYQKASSAYKEIKTPVGPGHHSEEVVDEAFKMPPETAAEKMQRLHQKIRKEKGLPDPDHYLKLAKQKQKEIDDMKNEEVEELDDPKGTMTRVAEKTPSKKLNLIKTIYRESRGIKEDTYDHEKDDKDPARVYGKAPKLDKETEKNKKTKESEQAAATLSGGTTLTKQDRDDIELDPTMKVRSDPSDKDDKKLIKQGIKQDK